MKFKTSLAAKKNRLRRRVSGSLAEITGSFGVLLFIAMFSGLFVYGYSYILSCSYFEIKETSVRGLKELTEKEILSLAAIRPKQNLLAVNTDLVTRRISASPWVKRAYVGREFPNRLVLEIRERTPLALIKQTNDLYMVDTDGHVFKKLEKTDEVDLPVLVGFQAGDRDKLKILTATFDLFKMLAASGRHDYLGAAAEIKLDDVFGLSVLTDKGLYLKMGRDDYENKLKQLSIVMKDMDKRGLAEGYIYVDLRDITKITISRRSGVGKAEMRKKSANIST